jgi:hypothetical protein
MSYTPESSAFNSFAIRFKKYKEGILWNILFIR